MYDWLMLCINTSQSVNNSIKMMTSLYMIRLFVSDFDSLGVVLLKLSKCIQRTVSYSESVSKICTQLTHLKMIYVIALLKVLKEVRFVWKICFFIWNKLEYILCSLTMHLKDEITLVWSLKRAQGHELTTPSQIDVKFLAF